jgi:hypothetical protein
MIAISFYSDILLLSWYSFLGYLKRLLHVLLIASLIIGILFILLSDLFSSFFHFSGIFTCPMDGIYGFYFSIATVHVNQIVAKLVINSINEVDGVADTFHTNQEAQGSNFVLVSLTKGQQVWVANYRWATHVMQESDGYRFSSFSGFLLY